VAHESQPRPLREDEIAELQANGCTADDWACLRASEPFDTQRVRHACFVGCNVLGSNAGSVRVEGIVKPAGVYNTMLKDCTVGADARLANVGSHVAGYDIADGVCIENVSLLQTNPGATFGHGVEVEVLNEAGGREVPLFAELSAQFAHLLCLHRHRPALIEKLSTLVQAEVDKATADRGSIGTGSLIRGVGTIIDVNVGPYARIEGAASLRNGTILSEEADPTVVGADMQASDFMIAEGSHVAEGAILDKTYVGQGCRIGKQYSAEGSLFFANCEGFHGEACSVFAGPYTVTHHKGTLLIAGQFSFYNAGSSTNQSNHMYKLGPAHEGKMERGGKTGSFSYMMWPCRVGPFSVVLGKHTRHFDTGDFPFSHIEASADGKCSLIPGFNLSTVGTVRDGEKWPKRDRRQGSCKRDRLSFDVFSPFTMGRMLRGMAVLEELRQKTDKSIDSVTVKGAEIKRVLLRSGQKYYRTGLQMYLLDQVVRRLEQGLAAGAESARAALTPAKGAIFSEAWLDLAGLLLPQARLESLWQAIESGEIASVEDFHAQLDCIQASYDEDAWAWCAWAYGQVFERPLDEVPETELAQLIDDFVAARKKFLGLILLDSRKEFDETMRMGFGADAGECARDVDFEAVRGTYENNSFVRSLEEEIASLDERAARLRTELADWLKASLSK
jgi:Domain of unknown function (DUF4954)/Domain of unknown function (DUF6819)